jgi:WD40 repeat protein
MRLVSLWRLWFFAATIAAFSFQTAVAELFYTAYRNSGVNRANELTGQVKATLASSSALPLSFRDFVGLTVGHDGNLYVSSRLYYNMENGRWGVYRLDPENGDYLGWLIDDGPLYHITFGPDGDLYGVYSWTDSLYRYDGKTGKFKNGILDGDDFGYYGVGSFTFLPDGTLFAVTGNSDVARYQPATGERIGPITSLIDFGLNGYGFEGMAVGPDGNVYVAYNYHGRDQVLEGGVMRFDGATGSFLDIAVSGISAFGAASGGSLGLAFGTNGDLYVGSQRASAVLRFDWSTGEQLGSLPLNGTVTGASYLVFAEIPEPNSGKLVCTALIIAAAAAYTRNTRSDCRTTGIP